MLRLAAGRDALQVVADQIGAPTPAAWIADASAHVLQQGVRDSGIWNVVAAGQTSWHGFAEAIIEQAHASGHVGAQAAGVGNPHISVSHTGAAASVFGVGDTGITTRFWHHSAGLARGLARHLGRIGLTPLRWCWRQHAASSAGPGVQSKTTTPPRTAAPRAWPVALNQLCG